MTVCLADTEVTVTKEKKVLSDRDTAMTPLVVTFCHLATLHSSGLWRNRQRRTLQCQLMWPVLTPKGNLNNYSTTESRSLWNTDSVWEHFSALRLRTGETTTGCPFRQTLQESICHHPGCRAAWSGQRGHRWSHRGRQQKHYLCHVSSRNRVRLLSL